MCVVFVCFVLVNEGSFEKMVLKYIGIFRVKYLILEKLHGIRNREQKIFLVIIRMIRTPVSLSISGV